MDDNRSAVLIRFLAAYGAKASDAITSFVGSWIFVGIHTLWFLIWILLKPEPFPFGLLTLLVSLEAIFLSTFVMMSQNRQSVKDRQQADRIEALSVKDVKIEELLSQHMDEQRIMIAEQNKMLQTLLDK